MGLSPIAAVCFIAITSRIVVEGTNHPEEKPHIHASAASAFFDIPGHSGGSGDRHGSSGPFDDSSFSSSTTSFHESDLSFDLSSSGYGASHSHEVIEPVSDGSAYSVHQPVGHQREVTIPKSRLFGFKLINKRKRACRPLSSDKLTVVNGKSYFLPWKYGHGHHWVTRRQARALCRRICMDLPTLETEHEVRALGNEVRYGDVHGIWTSGVHRKNGIWRWTPSNNVIGYPSRKIYSDDFVKVSNNYGNVRHCLALTSSNWYGGDVTLRKATCDDTMAFACQGDVAYSNVQYDSSPSVAASQPYTSDY